MQQLGEYVVCMTAAAMISGILLSLFPEGAVRSLLRLGCGVFLAITALSPLPGLSMPDIPAFSQSYLDAGKAAAAAGEAMARESRNRRIKQTLEAYILDKATALGTTLQPDITLSDDGSPVRVMLQGGCDTETRRQLEEMITNDLGIPGEDQQWIVNNGQGGSGPVSENTVGQP